MLVGADGSSQECEGVIDTGFNGFLMLPMSVLASLGCAQFGTARVILADGREDVFETYTCTIVWDGQKQDVEVAGNESFSLVGMGMLQGFKVQLDVIDRGKVTIKTLAPARPRKRTKRR